jgi:tRNA(Ile)-lysidine synthase
VDVPAIAKQSGTSVEMAARDARYTFFSDIMRQHRVPLLLTAHHADDNLETVLLHLTRGCGLSGLGGIAPVRPFERVPNSVIVRPLLYCSKADILEACDALSLDFVLDSTNDDVAYDRNFMRSRVLPSLKELGGQAELRITRTCATLREDEEYLTQAADRFIEAHAEGDILLREPLMTAHPAIGKRVLRLWILRLTGQLPESCHTERLWALCRENVSSRVIHLPGNYTVTVGKADLRIAKRSDAILNNSSLDEPLTMGTKDFLALGWQVTLLAKDEADISCEQHKKNTQVGKNVYNPFIRDTLTFDTILECDMQRLRWRGRREGDTLLWRGVHRKLRKLQNEVGIPVDLRDRLPLLCDGDRILWAPFIGAADGAFETATPSSAAFRLTIQAIPITDFSKEEAPL